MKPKKVKVLLNMAKEQATLSPDLNTKVGGIVTDQKGGTLLSSYNGFVEDAPDGKLPASGQDKYEYIVHCEENAICRAARKGVALDNTIMFITLSPCKKCTRLLYETGIRTVYFLEQYKDFQENLKMKDINLTLYQLDGYYKVTMEPKK